MEELIDRDDLPQVQSTAANYTSAELQDYIGYALDEEHLEVATWLLTQIPFDERFFPNAIGKLYHHVPRALTDYSGRILHGAPF